VDHEIFGEVSLYGMPAADDLGQDDLKIFSAMLHEPTITFAKSGGLLQMRGNQLTSLTAGEDMVRAIKKLRLTKKGELQEVYRAAFVSDNWLRTRHSPLQRWLQSGWPLRQTLTRQVTGRMLAR
jgi:hypothetical protein